MGFFRHSREIRLLERILHTLERIEKQIPRLYSVRVTQEDDMAIGNITAGTTGTFAAQLLDNGSPVATQPQFTWTADDTSVTITPSADTASAEVSVPAGDTGTSVTVTASATAPDGSTVSGSLTVPLTPAPQNFTIAVTQTA